MKQVKHVTMTLTDYDANNEMLSCIGITSDKAINIERLETVLKETAERLGFDTVLWQSVTINDKGELEF